MMLDPVARLRRFNRAVVREAGALDTSFLGRGRPLGAARVLHLVRPEGTDVAMIRARLGLDSGLMSRFLRALERERLIITETDPADRRRSIARLTPVGEAEVAAYLAIIHDQASQILTRAGSRADEVLTAMDLIATILNRDQVEFRTTDPDAAEAQDCLRAYFAELEARVPHAHAQDFPLPDPEADSYRPPLGRFLVAWSDEMPIGCVALKRLAGTTGEVKRLWVAAAARGQGLARRLMVSIEADARAMGLRSLKLETNHVLTEAVALYRDMGWADTPAFTAIPADTWLAKVL